jgi:hypothetical protein
MEYVKKTYSHNDEFQDLYVGLGVDGTEAKEEHINLVETIKRTKPPFFKNTAQGQPTPKEPRLNSGEKTKATTYSMLGLWWRSYV